MDSEYLGTYSVLAAVLAGALVLLACAVFVAAVRSGLRRWGAEPRSAGRRLSLVAAGAALFLLLFVLIGLLFRLLGYLLLG